jgi:hypothetical protein
MDLKKIFQTDEVSSARYALVNMYVSIWHKKFSQLLRDHTEFSTVVTLNLSYQDACKQLSTAYNKCRIAISESHNDDYESATLILQNDYKIATRHLKKLKC